MTLQERMLKSETRVVKAVFPHTTNHYQTLFGGTALQWMDEIAFITATRFSRQEYVTVSLDRIDFTKAIPSGTMVELIGRVLKIGNTSVEVLVEVYVEQMFSDARELAINGRFTMVAVDANGRPVKVR